MAKMETLFWWSKGKKVTSNELWQILEYYVQHKQLQDELEKYVSKQELSITLEDYALKEEIPDISNLVTNEQFTDATQELQHNIENNTVLIEELDNEHKELIRQVDVKVETNKTNISTNTNDISSLRAIQDELVAQLKAAKLWNIRGAWDASTNYKIGDVVGLESNQTLYVALKDNTNVNPTSDLSTWFPVSGVQQIDLSDYYDKNQIDTLLEDIRNLIKGLSNRIDTNAESIEALDAKVNTKADASDINSLRNELANKANKSELTQYAKLDVANTFTAENKFNTITFTDYIWSEKDGSSYVVAQQRKNDDGTGTLLIGAPRNDVELWYTGDPKNDNSIVTKRYVDNRLSGITVPSNVVKTDTEQTITGNKSFDNDMSLLNRHRIRFKKDNSASVLEIYPGSQNNNAYVDARIGELVLSGSVINVNNKRITNVATPTSNTDAATKQYVDGKVAGVVTVSGNNTFTGTNTFNSDINIGSIGKIGNDGSGNVLVKANANLNFQSGGAFFNSQVYVSGDPVATESYVKNQIASAGGGKYEIKKLRLSFSGGLPYEAAGSNQFYSMKSISNVTVTLEDETVDEFKSRFDNNDELCLVNFYNSGGSKVFAVGVQFANVSKTSTNSFTSHLMYLYTLEAKGNSSLGSRYGFTYYWITK